MRKLRDIHGLFNGRHFDREVVSSGRRYAERLSQQGGWARALSPLFELSTYFRINAAKTGQFERTLIIADRGYVSYREGVPHRCATRTSCTPQ